MPSTTPLTDAINALTTYSNTVTGASDTTLSDAVATLAAGYGGGGGGLPSIYTARNYIQSNGDAYINMGFNEAIGTSMVIEAAFDGSNATRQFSLFGYQGTSVSSQRFVLLLANSNGGPVYYASTSGNAAVNGWVYGQKNTVKVDFSANATYPVFTINNTTTTGSKPKTNTTGGGMGDWFLLAQDYQGSPTATDLTVGDAYARCYGFKLTMFGITVRNFLPCTRNADSVAGFWDTCTETFYPSIGGQAFTYG